MGEAAGPDGRGKLIMTGRDLTLPPLGTATGNWGGGSGLRETVAELGLAIPGASLGLTYRERAQGLAESVAELDLAIPGAGL